MGTSAVVCNLCQEHTFEAKLLVVSMHCDLVHVSEYMN